jgi:MFS family permease
MTGIAATTDDANEAQARRNALLLSAAAAFAGSAPAIALTVGGLAGIYLLGPDKSLATLPLSFLMVGIAAGAVPAAWLMHRIGRRGGFVVGAAIGVVGSLIAAFAVLAGTFVGFTVGLTVVGFAGSFTQQYRFAAADRGSPTFRAKAISWVLAGGVAAAVIGPQTVILTSGLFDPVPYAGAFFGMGVLLLVALAVLTFLGGAAREAPTAEVQTGGRPLAVIARQPRFIVALICAIGAYALMSLLMTAAPLAMVHFNHGQANAALGIQWHVIAMFAPSFVTGHLIARFGKEPVIAIGLALLAGCAVVALSGVNLAQFWSALILLGIGWNFGFIGATAMLNETYRPEEKDRVEGLNDLLVFGSVAIASFSSGRLFATIGWEAMNVYAFPIIAICVVALATAALARRARRG